MLFNVISLVIAKCNAVFCFVCLIFFLELKTFKKSFKIKIITSYSVLCYKFINLKTLLLNTHVYNVIKYCFAEPTHAKV